MPQRDLHDRVPTGRLLGEMELDLLGFLEPRCILRADGRAHRERCTPCAPPRSHLWLGRRSCSDAERGGRRARHRHAAARAGADPRDQMRGRCCAIKTERCVPSSLPRMISSPAETIVNSDATRSRDGSGNRCCSWIAHADRSEQCLGIASKCWRLPARREFALRRVALRTHATLGRRRNLREGFSSLRA